MRSEHQTLTRWVAGLLLLACAASACGASKTSSPAQVAAAAGNRLLDAPNFIFSESDRGTSTSAGGAFSLASTGTLTQHAVLATLIRTVGATATRFTVYATRTTYCQLGLAAGSGCTPGDGYDDGLTFVALPYLRLIAKGAANVKQSGRLYTFSGSEENSETTPSVHETWHGSFTISGGYVVALQFTETDSQGGNGSGRVTFSRIGTSPAISAPPGADG